MKGKFPKYSTFSLKKLSVTSKLEFQTLKCRVVNGSVDCSVDCSYNKNTRAVQ